MPQTLLDRLRATLHALTTSLTCNKTNVLCELQFSKPIAAEESNANTRLPGLIRSNNDEVLLACCKLSTFLVSLSPKKTYPAQRKPK